MNYTSDRDRRGPVEKSRTEMLAGFWVVALVLIATIILYRCADQLGALSRLLAG